MDSPPGRQALAEAAPAYLLQRRRGRGPLYLAGQSRLAPPAGLWRGSGSPSCLSTYCLAGDALAHTPRSRKTASASLDVTLLRLRARVLQKAKGASSDAPLL